MISITKMSSQNHQQFKRPNCYSTCFSPAKQDVWGYLSARAPFEDTVEINMSNLAQILDVSRATIQHALKTFISCNLIKKVRERTGRGNGSIFRFLWSFNPKSETLPDNTTCYRPYPRKKLTKGSSEYSYSAMHFRKLLEKIPLGISVGDAVGAIMDRLEGKMGKLAENVYNELAGIDLSDYDKPDWYVNLANLLPPDREAYFHRETFNSQEERELYEKVEKYFDWEFKESPFGTEQKSDKTDSETNSEVQFEDDKTVEERIKIFEENRRCDYEDY